MQNACLNCVHFGLCLSLSLDLASADLGLGLEN